MDVFDGKIVFLSRWGIFAAENKKISIPITFSKS